MRLFTVPLFLALASAQTTPINNLTVDTRACTGAFASLPFCDASLSREARLNDLIDRLWSNPTWITHSSQRGTMAARRPGLSTT